MEDSPGCSLRGPPDQGLVGGIVVLSGPGSWVRRSGGSLLSPSAGSNFALCSGVGHVPIACAGGVWGAAGVCRGPHILPCRVVCGRCV